MSKRTDDYWVTVCNHCLRASCWHGELYCEQAKHAGTIEMKASELDDMTEHPSNYSREKIVSVWGSVRELDDVRI